MRSFSGSLLRAALAAALLLLLLHVQAALGQGSSKEVSYPIAGAGTCAWTDYPCNGPFNNDIAAYPTVWDGSLVYLDVTPEGLPVTNVTLTLYGAFPADGGFDGVQIPVSINGDVVSTWTYSPAAYADSCTAAVDESPMLVSDGGAAYVTGDNNTVTFAIPAGGPELEVCGMIVEVYYVAEVSPTPTVSPTRSLTNTPTASRSVGAPSVTRTPTVSGQAAAEQPCDLSFDVGTWTLYDYVPSGTYNEACTSAYGYYYLLGGQSPAWHRYCVAKDEWEALPPPPAEVTEGAMASVVGDVLFLIGGVSNPTSNQRLNLTDLTWMSSGSSLPFSLSRGGSAAYGGLIYIFGGNHDNVSQGKTFVYDPQADSWSGSIASMPSPAYAFGTTRLDDVIYVLGGNVYESNAESLSVARVFNITSLSWSTLPPMNVARTAVRAATAQGKIFVIGGKASPSNGPILSSVEVYDPTTGTWAMPANMTLPLAMSNNCAFPISDGLPWVWSMDSTGAYRYILQHISCSSTPTPSVTASRSFTASTTPSRTASSSPSLSHSFSSSTSRTLTPSPSPSPSADPPASLIDVNWLAADTVGIVVAVILLISQVTVWACRASGGVPAYPRVRMPSLEPGIHLSIAYAQHVALGSFFPGTFPDSFSTWSAAFSWSALLNPFGLHWPATDDSDSTSTVSRNLLGLEQAAGAYGKSTGDLFPSFLVWLTVTLFVYLFTTQVLAIIPRLSSNQTLGGHSQLPDATIDDTTVTLLSPTETKHGSNLRSVATAALLATLEGTVVLFLPLVTFSAIECAEIWSEQWEWTFGSVLSVGWALVALLLSAGLPLLTMGWRLCATATPPGWLPGWPTVFLLCICWLLGSTLGWVDAAVPFYIAWFVLLAALLVSTIKLSGCTAVNQNVYRLCIVALMVRLGLVGALSTTTTDILSSLLVGSIVLEDCLCVAGLIVVCFWPLLRFLARSKSSPRDRFDVRMQTLDSIMKFEDIIVSTGIEIIPTNEIEMGQKIGRGAGGVVRAARWQGRDVAVKQLVNVSDLEMRADGLAIKEVQLLLHAQHEHIVKFFGVCFRGGDICLVLELMEYGSLSTAVARMGEDLTAQQRLHLILDAGKALCYLHENRILHRDVKPQNLLVNNQLVCKVADFGISTLQTNSKTMTAVGTPAYMAPEVLNHARYGTPADVYSFAVVVIEVLTLRRPYSEYASLNEVQLLFKIFHENLRPSTDGLPEVIRQLLDSAMSEDPQHRPTMAGLTAGLQEYYEEQGSSHA